MKRPAAKANISRTSRRSSVVPWKSTRRSGRGTPADSNASAPQNFAPRYNPHAKLSRPQRNDRPGQNFGDAEPWRDAARVALGRRGGRHRGGRPQGGPGGRNLPPSEICITEEAIRGYETRALSRAATITGVRSSRRRDLL